MVSADRLDARLGSVSEPTIITLPACLPAPGPRAGWPAPGKPRRFGAVSLLGAAEGWLRERGMRRVIGPFSLSINEESGLLVDGFATPPMLLMGHARPYYRAHLERAGYRKCKDLHAYWAQ
jgi:hypothetical protein